MNDEPLKVFISYSHDSSEHRAWVLDLATNLVRNGVHVIIDQWDLKHGDDIAIFIEENLNQCDYVIAVCSENYVEKANNRTGGVGYEGMILTKQILEDVSSVNIIPIIKQSDGDFKVPTFLGTRFYADFSVEENNTQQFQELLKSIYKDSYSSRPALGRSPFSQEEEVSENKVDLGEDAKEVISFMLDQHNRGIQTSFYATDLRDSFAKGVIFFNKAIDELRSHDLIENNGPAYLRVTEKTIAICVENDWVSKVEG